MCMSVNEIMQELEKLSPDELSAIQEKLNLMRSADDDEETPEMLAAIDEALQEKGSIPIEQVMEEMKTWNFKSP